MKAISQLFEDKPTQWGLRGDPHLWEEMRIRLELIPMPEISADLERILRSVFMELTGGRWDSFESVFVARYDKGGISSGMVSPEFWKDEAIPLLLSRYDSTKGGTE